MARLSGWFVFALMPAALPGQSSGVDKNVAKEKEDIVELSPFTVNASEVEGYRAETTLAGTRLKTQIRDLGAAISVFTPQFFEDTGAMKAADALVYALNMDVGGTQGNYAGGGVKGSRSSQDNQRDDPQNGQRVRGLSPASLTRNFFLTDIPFDDYNISGVTINRGPNSLLFGIGSPGGVIDASLSRASLAADSGEVSARAGERESNRETFSFNKVIIKDRLGARIASLHDQTNYQQKPAYERDKRLYAAFEAVLFKNEKSAILGKTRLRGNYETGLIVGTPPNVIPPNDSISDWFSPPNPAWQQITGTTFPPWVTNGSFVPKFTVNTLTGASPSNINGSVETPYFLQLALYYNDANSKIASIGLPDASLQGGQGRIPYTVAKDGRPQIDLFSTNAFAFSAPGFSVPVIMNTKVFDNRNRLASGNTNRVERGFDATNVALEQSLFGGRAGIELVYDHQKFDRRFVLPFSTGGSGLSGNGDIAIDVDRYLANDMPNPNLGRPVMRSTNFGSYSFNESERNAVSATAYYQLNFIDLSKRLGWLGRHVFTGFYGDQTIDTLGRDFEASWDSTTVNLERVYGPGTIAQLSQFRRQVIGIAYVGPSLLDPSIKSLDDVRITNVVNVPVPKNGDVHEKLFYFDPADRRLKQDEFYVHTVLGGGNITRQTIESQAVSWQSYLANNNIVGLVGWRKDKTKTFERVSDNRLPTGEYDPANLRLTANPTFMAEGNTFTWSAVGHVPKRLLRMLPFKPDLTFHYNVSENFSPTTARRNVYNEILPPPSGKTKEYGFTVEVLDGKLAARVNWFETSSSLISTDVGGAVGNATGWIGTWLDRWKQAELLGMTIEQSLALTGPSAAGRFKSYSEAYAAIIALLPPEEQALRNFRFEGNVVRSDPILGQTDTTSYVAKGFEIEIMGNPMPNWRMALNVGQQATVPSNTAPALTKLAYAVRDNIVSSGLATVRDSPAIGEVETFAVRYARYVLIPLGSALTKDGTVALEQRKWRANLVTNYSFAGEGFLKGVGVGGALRWQDKVATGYALRIDALGAQVPDLTRPFFGPTELNGDVWASYRRKLSDRINWKVQLNARNAVTRKGYIPVITNPDGSLAVVRNPNPTEFFVTNTFTF